MTEVVPLKILTNFEICTTTTRKNFDGINRYNKSQVH